MKIILDTNWFILLGIYFNLFIFLLTIFETITDNLIKKLFECKQLA